MIPAPPRISAPPRPRPSPRREPRPRGPSPATRPKANDADIPHSSATPQEISSNGSTPVPARPAPAPLGGVPFHPRPPTCLRPAPSAPSARLLLRLSPRPPAPLPRSMPVGCRMPSTTPVSNRPHHAYLGPLTPQPGGCLLLEQFNECGVLPDRFGRAPHSLKTRSRGGVTAGVSGGREDDSADGTGQGSGLASGIRPLLGAVSSTPPDGLVGAPDDPAPRRAFRGDVKSRPFGESYRAVRWAGSRGYEPGSGRGRACMATLELRILRRFAWSCG
jgi:hypothetical protein